MQKLLIIWVIVVIAFAGYKTYEYFERKKVLEQSRPNAEKVIENTDTSSPENEQPTHTVIPSSDKFFTKKRVYTNEDIRKMNEKKKKRGVITKEEMKKYHKE